MRQYFLTITAPFAIQSYGENHYNNASDSTCSSIHAEENAMRKLLPLRRQKKLKKVDLLVIRVSKSGQLGNSKPCIHCILNLSKNLPDKGYVLHAVHYTDETGEIKTARFQNLLQETTPHISRFYVQKNFKIK
jgi:hypothetical protein